MSLYPLIIPQNDCFVTFIYLHMVNSDVKS